MCASLYVGLGCGHACVSRGRVYRVVASIHVELTAPCAQYGLLGEPLPGGRYRLHGRRRRWAAVRRASSEEAKTLRIPPLSTPSVPRAPALEPAPRPAR
eukprot:347755-Prymnesium_polylepis.1